ncbi:hypothetical protein Avbf_03577 [Armadillidium vulgare]|nr:hypothetical protein Avbf_03577 [Armadillidium vulgare]
MLKTEHKTAVTLNFMSLRVCLRWRKVMQNFCESIISCRVVSAVDNFFKSSNFKYMFKIIHNSISFHLVHKISFFEELQSIRKLFKITSIYPTTRYDVSFIVSQFSALILFYHFV